MLSRSDVLMCSMVAGQRVTYTMRTIGVPAKIGPCVCSTRVQCVSGVEWRLNARSVFSESSVVLVRSAARGIEPPNALLSGTVDGSDT
jgi:hypothetical protein